MLYISGGQRTAWFSAHISAVSRAPVASGFRRDVTPFSESAGTHMHVHIPLPTHVYTYTQMINLH